ncbi:MAG: phage integrase SAM-like domain-containing protein [Crocinitomicaceae bacterium]
MKTSIKIHWPKPKRTKEGLYQAYLRTIYKGKKCEAKVKEEYLKPITEEDLLLWDSAVQRFPNQIRFKQHNDYIAELENKHADTIYRERDSIQFETAQSIRNKLLNRMPMAKKILLIDAYDHFINKSILPSAKAAGTKRNYVKSFNHFKEFLNKESLTKIGLSEFDRKHANAFKDYLLSNKLGLMAVSAHSVLKNVKPFFTRKFDNDEIQKNPFNKVFVKFEPTEKSDITEKDFAALYHLKFTEYPNLELYRDIFLFMSCTGMIYQDLFAYKRSQLIKTDKGTKISFKRMKSGILCEQFTVNIIEDLLTKYENDPHVQIEDGLIPKRGLNEINKNLKLLSLMVGSKYPWTTYHARRFFSEAISDVEIADPIVVSRLMGHSTHGNVLARYRKAKDKKLRRVRKKLNRYFSKLVEQRDQNESKLGAA